MIVKGSYDKVEDVPQEFKDSFTEVEGKFLLTGSIETKDTTDYKELHKLKQSSFDEMHGLKEQLKAETQKAVEVQNKLDIANIKIQDGAVPDDKLQELVETRVKVATEQLTAQLAEANEKNAGYQNTIHGNEKNEFINGFKSEFSETVGKEISLIGNTLFERQADNSYLTVENKTLGIDAGLTREQAVTKLNVSMPNWQKQNTADNASGGSNGGQSGTNPFAKDSFNRTEQHKILQENPALAKSMQAQAQKE